MVCSSIVSIGIISQIWADANSYRTGDLGTSPKEVEAKLQEAFQLAQLWKCVLLLDEADIFLAHRSENDIERNALVSGK